MRLFGKPGGTRGQLRAALLTVPFDRALPMAAPSLPDACFAAPPRGAVFAAPTRGAAFGSVPRGTVFEPQPFPRGR